MVSSAFMQQSHLPLFSLPFTLLALGILKIISYHWNELNCSLFNTALKIKLHFQIMTLRKQELKPLIGFNLELSLCN